MLQLSWFQLLSTFNVQHSTNHPIYFQLSTFNSVKQPVRAIKTLELLEQPARAIKPLELLEQPARALRTKQQQ